MKKLRKKNGFTLVECVVAMAILAIMTLMLAMMVNIIVNLRNHNRNVEEDIDEQVKNIVEENSLIEEDASSKSDLKFSSNGIVISGTNANKVYFDDPNSDVQIGALDYGFDDDVVVTQPTETQPGETTPEEEDPPALDNGKVYGAVTPINPTDMITISETSKSTADGYHTIIWKISFNVQEESSVEKSLKVVFPTGSQLISYKKTSGTSNVHNVNSTTVRIEPESGSQWTLMHIEVEIEFKISEANYTAAGGNVSSYFTGSGSGNTVSIPINFKPNT